MPEIKVDHNGVFDIAIGRNRKETSWKNKEMQWSEFVQMVSTTHRTAETYSEYNAAKKMRQDEIKDIGGFVGGYLNSGRRKSSNVIHRQLITLDIDFGNADVWSDFLMLYGNAALVYSTHKHSSDNPRLRLILPLDRPVAADEYTAIARRIAGSLDIELFDPTTFQPERLMYWPSTSKDGEFFFDYQDGEWISADEVLKTYHNWKDSSEWPVSVKVDKIRMQAAKDQGIPTEKKGVVGSFCRAYDIHSAIDVFLSDVYSYCDHGRYTFLAGSTSAGLITYDDMFSYSHHGTDPTCEKLCNAFDLVRLHLFGAKDDAVKENTPAHKHPSFAAMEEMARQDPLVRKLIAQEKLENANIDFAGIETEDNVEIDQDAYLWMEELEADKKSNYLSTRQNFKLILENDPKLKGCFAFDLFAKRDIVTRHLPWRKVTDDTKLVNDADISNLRIFMSAEPYKLSNNSFLSDAFASVLDDRTVHPVLDYLRALRWDGTKRLDTLFIDYMGGEDSEYTRAITRKTLVAAVARVFQPGIKFDHVLTLIGEEGKQKSTIFRMLAKRWFSDSFSFSLLKHEKSAFEQLQGYWIIEIAELTGLRKADIEGVKQFLTKGFDVYRIPHKSYTSNFKRQCIFVASTNEWNFLQSNNGNRRFWPIAIHVNTPGKKIDIDLTDSEIDQIWAEAVQLYKSGESLYLTKELEHQAKEAQVKHTLEDERIGRVQNYLDTPVPDDWSEKTIGDRYAYFARPEEDIFATGTKIRMRVCAAEIWRECFGGGDKEMNAIITQQMHSLMRSIPGWVRLEGKKKFGVYGVQRGYERVSVLDELAENDEKEVADDDFL